MSQKKKSSAKEASRKRPLDNDNDELSYNAVANLTGASPVVHHGKSKGQQKTKAGSSKPPLPKKTVPAKRDDSPTNTTRKQPSPKKASPTKSKGQTLPMYSPTVGSKVKISKKTEKHSKFRGQIGSVVSISSLWTKVQLLDEDGEEAILSFKNRDLLEVEPSSLFSSSSSSLSCSSSSSSSSSTQNPDQLKKKRNDNISVKSNQNNKKKKVESSHNEEEDDEEEEGGDEYLSYPIMPQDKNIISNFTSMMRRFGNGGESLVSGEGIAAVTEAAIKQEIEFLKSQVNEQSKDGRQLISLFSKISEACSQNIPIAIKNSRRRRMKDLSKVREVAMKQRYASLQKEEQQWLKLQSQLDSGELDGSLLGEMNNDDDDEEDEEDDVNDVIEGLDMTKELSKVKSNIESMSIVLDEQTTQVRKLEESATRAKEMQQQLVAKNKAHQFDNYPSKMTVLGKEGKNIKDLIRNFTS